LNKTEKEKMLAGELYRPGDPELQADAVANKAWLARYNAALAAPVAERHALLSAHFGRVGTGAVIRPPFFCDYGYNIRLGDEVFLNFNCVILDVVEVVIGDRTQIGPATQIYAADHPRDAETRRTGLEFGRPVRLDRRRRHHPARDHDRRRRCDRRRQRGHARRRRGPDGCRKPGPAPSEMNQPSMRPGLCDFPVGCYGKPHVCAAHHQH
jgi:maltose O-acetyltransferase